MAQQTPAASKREIESLRGQVADLRAEVTERKAAEEALRQSEERFRSLLENANDAIVVLQDGKAVFRNPLYETLLGYTVAETRDRLFLENVSPEDRDQVRDYHARRIRGETAPEQYEVRILTRSGRKLTMEVRPRVIEYGGKPAAMVIMRDVTERIQAEEALRIQKELTEAAIQSSPNSLLVVEPDLTVVLANRTCHEAFGIPQGQAEGRQLVDVVPLKGLCQAVEQTIAAKRGQLGLEFRDKGAGGERILVGNVVPVRSASGQAEQRVFVSLRDVTTERATQERLYHTEKLASIGQMAAGIAHELNNPLASVLGYVELLQQTKLPEEARQDLGTIEANAQRAAAVVKNLLAFARPQKPRRSTMDLNEIVNKIVEMRRYELNVSNVELLLALAPDLPMTTVDAGQIEQVFMNIVVNAEQAMVEAHNGGTLTIQTKARGVMVEVSFADDGPGIPKEHIDQLFDPFFTTKEPGKGTGLGLSICHGIVSEHNGRLEVESEQGKGTTFVVSLPTTTQDKIRDSE